MFNTIISAIKGHHANTGFIPLHAPVFQGNEEAYVLETIRSTFVSSVGEFVSRFEKELEQITGAGQAVACVNGTAALQVALQLVGVTCGDYVLTQSLSFVATSNAIAHAGATPIFVDVERESMGMCPRALQSFLETSCERTATGVVYKQNKRPVVACVPMHTFGHPCKIQEIAAICEEWGLSLVEDAAEALGSSVGGKHCGTFGAIGTLSFNGNKTITTGGGGALLFNDKTLGSRAKHLTTTAKVQHPWAFFHDNVAWNYRMPNLNAALGCAQLEQLPAFIATKRGHAAFYQQLFAPTPWQFMPEPKGTHSNYWLCAVLLTNAQERDQFLEASNAAGVMTRPAWAPLHTLPMYEQCPRGPLENTLFLAERLVNLPSGICAA